MRPSWAPANPHMCCQGSTCTDRLISSPITSGTNWSSATLSLSLCKFHALTWWRLCRDGGANTGHPIFHKLTDCGQKTGIGAGDRLYLVSPWIKHTTGCVPFLCFDGYVWLTPSRPRDVTSCTWVSHEVAICSNLGGSRSKRWSKSVPLRVLPLPSWWYHNLA